MPGANVHERSTKEIRLAAHTTNLGTIEVSFLYHSIEMRVLEARQFARELLTAVSDAEQQLQARRQEAPL